MKPRAQTLVFGLFLAALWLAVPRAASACSCMPQTAEQARRSACAVFEGLVLSIDGIDAQGELAPMHLRVRFKVLQTWTPGIGEQIVITTAGSSAACGYPFEVGRSYVVYADGGHTETPVVGICGGTKPREDASDDLKQLGMGVVPVSPVQRTATSSTSVERAGCASCNVGQGTRNANLTLLALVTACLLLWRGLARL